MKYCLIALLTLSIEGAHAQIGTNNSIHAIGSGTAVIPTEMNSSTTGTTGTNAIPYPNPNFNSSNSINPNNYQGSSTTSGVSPSVANPGTSIDGNATAPTNSINPNVRPVQRR